MRILLIQPPYVPFRVPLNARHPERPPAVAPLGLGMIAAVLRARGHDVTYLDHYCDDFDAVLKQHNLVKRVIVDAPGESLAEGP